MDGSIKLMNKPIDNGRPTSARSHTLPAPAVGIPINFSQPFCFPIPVSSQSVKKSARREEPLFELAPRNDELDSSLNLMASIELPQMPLSDTMLNPQRLELLLEVIDQKKRKRHSLFHPGKRLSSKSGCE
jgi:hypothetical protein